MKVLKILGIVLGALLLLTGGALLAAAAVVGKGQSAFDSQVSSQGFAGPVDGVVKSVDSATPPVLLTVTFKDKQGTSRTGQGTSSDNTVPAVGSTVPVYYATADPTQILVLNVPGAGNLGRVGASLRTGGIVCLVIGAVLLVAGIAGLVVGRRRPAVTAGPPGQAAAGYPAQQPPGYGPPPGYQPPPPGYPQQNFPAQQNPGQPPYPQQPPAGYPQQYPQQPPPGYPQQYPEQPPSGPYSQPSAPQQPPQPPQDPPSASEPRG